MGEIFPSTKWLKALEIKLNTDERYARIAKNWEGDMVVVVEKGGPLLEDTLYYFDLWHGKCKIAEQVNGLPVKKPKYILTSSYENISRIMEGELDPMQAMMTRKLLVQGSMAYMMRNVPTVLDFVRCCRDVTSEILS